MLNNGGSIFFVKASYTSQLDPITGWRKITLTDENIEKMLKCGDFALEQNKTRNCITITYKTNSKASWTLDFANIDRLLMSKNIKGQFEITRYKLNEEMRRFLTEFSIDSGTNINHQVIKLLSSNNKNRVLKQLSRLFRLASNIRNSDKKNNVDAIYSAVYSTILEGYYNSDNYLEYQKLGLQTPKDADANGAYNIARKAQIIVDRIKTSDQKIDYFISDNQWDEYLLANSHLGKNNK
jgi:CRISPR-associated protein Cpf1